MASYETVFIVRPSLPDDDVEKVGEKIKGVITRHGGSILRVENWGKKKLAYEVRREKRGTYVLLHFSADGKAVGELERAYRLDESIIKFITVGIADERAGKPAEKGLEPAPEGRFGEGRGDRPRRPSDRTAREGE